MKKLITVVALSLLFVLPSFAGTITLYNNLTPNNSVAMTSSSTAGIIPTEAADDFVLSDQSTITNASFVGLLVSGTGGLPSVTDMTIEIYRVFPQDSDTTRTINVPTRMNSPSDVELTDRSSGAAEVTFTTTDLSSSFTTANSVQPGGIHAMPNQTTLGNGSLTGQEVQFDLTLTTPITLPTGHYFFVPQVALTNGGEFYWLSASRPISGVGTTPFTPDLQTWIRDDSLAPDWLRVGTDVIGGAPPTTFNAAFSLSGTVPEPSSLLLLLAGGAGLLGTRRFRRIR